MGRYDSEIMKIAMLITEDPDIMEAGRDYRRRFESMPHHQRVDSSRFYHKLNRLPDMKNLLIGLDSKTIIGMIDDLCSDGMLECHYRDGAKEPILNQENIKKIRETISRMRQ